MIAGDAAHQTPPFMGQGMCTGIRDAVNLAWKLVRVVRGQSRDTLLDTYTSERKPHAREYIETAIRLGAVIQTTDPEVAAARDAEMLARPTRMHAIAPQLGPGLLAEGAARPAGALVAQPRLADGTLLDDRVGSRFALVVRSAELIREVSGDAVPSFRGLDVCLVDATALGITAFLDELVADAVLLRPDRYALGVATGAAGLRALLEGLPEACHALG
jgi:3-(3-hydroxy-phenyl)propionate hydroxylase